MLKNLYDFMYMQELTVDEVANFLGMTPSNFNKKLAEAIPLSIDEVKKLRDRFMPSVDLEYLIESDGDFPSEKEKDRATYDALKGILDDIDADPIIYESLAAIRAESGCDEPEAG